MSPSPVILLRQAIQAVPSIRYALAVGGVLSVIAIAASFRLDFRIAVFGTLVMVLLMILVLLFARMTKLPTGLMNLPAAVLTWFTTTLMIATATCLFTSVFFAAPLDLRCWVDVKLCSAPPSPRTPEEEEVIRLKNEIMALQAAMETPFYPGSIEKLRRAEQLADAILSFPDSKLNPTRKYMKHVYAAYGYVMSAVGHQNDGRRVAMGRKALEHANTALSMFETAKNAYGFDANARLLVDWVNDDQGKDRTLYIKAMAACMLSKALNDKEAERQARAAMDLIDPRYEGEYPFHMTPQIAACLEEKK